MITPVRTGLLTTVLLLASPAWAAGRAVHLFDELALSPDGGRIATIEHDEPARDGDEPTDHVMLRPTDGGAAIPIALPCPAGPACKPSDLAFATDGRHFAFVLKQPNDGASYLEQVGADGTGLTQTLKFQGTLGGLRYGPDGTLAVLAVAGAHKEIGAIKAGAALAGEVGVSADEQRIGVVHDGQLSFASPPDLYVYEYDWRPHGAGFIATAAHGNGDNNWWIAQLWSVRDGAAKVIFTPPPREQLASPVVSPDGRDVAFIGGIMSDFGSTGGDAFRLGLDAPGRPVNLTPGFKASVTALTWRCGDGLTATALHGADTEILPLGGHAAGHPVWSGPETLTTGGWSLSLACAAGTSAAIHEDFATPPELQAGPIGRWHDLTRVNAGLPPRVYARSLTWRSDGFDVQGWLLQPANAVNADNQAMITMVHGGPSAAETPSYVTERRIGWLLDAGYDVFLPNPRGSFGQGEAFTQANVRDFGYGDLRDILRGVDKAIATAPISPDLLGLTGYSYGGYMTMWAVTQTDRFKAAVAGAGVSDWLSYYGENGIDRWMIPFFGASVYDDPKSYARSSPISFITRVRTPTFEYVGDRDLECPMPQTQEFWHALNTLGVPTEFVVYPGQGHELHDAGDRADAKARTLAWFGRWLRRAT